MSYPDYNNQQAYPQQGYPQDYNQQGGYPQDPAYAAGAADGYATGPGAEGEVGEDGERGLGKKLLVGGAVVAAVGLGVHYYRKNQHEKKCNQPGGHRGIDGEYDPNAPVGDFATAPTGYDSNYQQQGYPQQGYPPQQQGYPPQQGYPQPTPPQGGYILPLTYIPQSYTYSTSYSPTAQFVVPTGLDPRLQAKMMQASQIFRLFDKDHSGSLKKKEWKKGMKHLGYHFQKGEGKRVFKMIDRDGSHRISEREFCEFFLTSGM